MTWTDRAIAAARLALGDAEREHADAWKRRDRAAMAQHDARRERAERVLRGLTERRLDALTRACMVPDGPAPIATLDELKAVYDRLREICEARELRPVERLLVLAALHEAKNHRERAAALLGWSVRTFKRKLPRDAPKHSSLPPDSVIEAALVKAGGNRLAAARALGLHPRAFQRWVRKT